MMHEMLVEEMRTDEWIEHKQPEGSTFKVWESPPDPDGQTWKFWLSDEGNGTAQKGKTHGETPSLASDTLMFQWLGPATLDALAGMRDGAELRRKIAIQRGEIKPDEPADEPPDCNVCGRGFSVNADGMCAECAR